MDERREFRRKLLRLMLPIAFQNLMMTLVSATDALVLARVDQYEMAAVSLATEISFVMNLFLGTVVGSTAILAAQYLGKGDRKTLQNLMGMALRYNIAISLIFFLSTQAAPELLMKLYTSDPGLIKTGAGYLKTAGWSYLLSAVSQCYLCVMKASGGATVSAVIAALTAVVDVTVDIYLVYGLGLGAKGTAISTVAVCAVELLGVLIYSCKKEAIRPGFRDILCHRQELEADFRRISLPVLLGWIAWGLGYSLSAAVMGHVSADAASAYAVALLVQKIFTCFIRGLGNGAGIMVGQDLGSGDLALAKRNGSRLAKVSILCGIFSMVLLWCLGPVAFQFFILNDMTKEYLQQMLPICSVYLIAKSVSVVVICGVFPAGGDTKFDAQITAITMWLIALPLACLAAFVFHLPVIWVYLALCLDEFLKVLFAYPRFKKYYWLRNLTRDFSSERSDIACP